MIVEVLSEYGRFNPGPQVAGQICVGCGEALTGDDYPSLVNGFPADGEELEKALAGRAHNVECKVAHERCAYPDRPVRGEA